MIKNPPAIQETQETRVKSLCWEDPQEEEMAIHSTIFAGTIPWTEEPGRLQSGGHKKSDMTEHAHTHIYVYIPIYTHM